MQPMADSKQKVGFRERLRQFRILFRTTRQTDPRFLPVAITVPLVTLAAVVGLASVLGLLITGTAWWGFGLALGVPIALLVFVSIFGRRSQRAALTSIEGRTGAAAAVLEQMRGAWMVEPGVAVTRKEDLVHRVVGRPGVVLVGEGAPSRTAQLLKQEKRKCQRVTDAPVHEVNVGHGPGQVPLTKLQDHLQKLPRAVKRKQIGDLSRRLQSIGTSQPPMPKGPLPKGGRVPKQMRR